MNAFHKGDKTELKRMKRGRLTLMRHGEDIDAKRDHQKCAQEMRSKRRQRLKHDTRGHRVALFEFGEWCTKTFGDLESAWAFLDPVEARHVTRSDFMEKLQNYRYPTGNLGFKNVFVHLDSND